MLSTSPSKTQDVVLTTRPAIAHDTYNIYDEEFVDKLIDQISNLSSVYHRTAEDWNEQVKRYEKKMANVPEVTPMEVPHANKPQRRG